MTIFEEYMNESIKCTEMCKKYMNESIKCAEMCKKYMNKDTNLAMFYNNASIGFKEKALKLSLENADKMRA